MNPQTAKYHVITAPAAIVDDASPTTIEIDTLDYDWCRVVMFMGATDIALTAFNVTESDASGSGHAIISGANYASGTDIDGTALALPSATDDNGFFIFEIDLRGRKRYLDLAMTVGDGTSGAFVCAWAELYKGSEVPHTAALINAEIVRV